MIGLAELRPISYEHALFFLDALVSGMAVKLLKTSIVSLLVVLEIPDKWQRLFYEYTQFSPCMNIAYIIIILKE